MPRSRPWQVVTATCEARNDLAASVIPPCDDGTRGRRSPPHPGKCLLSRSCRDVTTTRTRPGWFRPTTEPVRHDLWLNTPRRNRRRTTPAPPPVCCVERPWHSDTARVASANGIQTFALSDGPSRDVGTHQRSSLSSSCIDQAGVVRSGQVVLSWPSSLLGPLRLPLDRRPFPGVAG